MKFSTKLTLIFSSVVLIMGAVISYFVYSSNVNTLEGHIKDRLMNQSFHTMDKIDRMLFERYADIKTLASDPVIMSGSATSKQITEKLMAYKNNYKAYASLSYFDLNRIRIADTEGIGLGRQHSLSEYWNGISRGMDFAYDISVSESLKKTVFHLAAVVKDEKGAPVGVVVSRLPVENLYDIVSQAVGIYDIGKDFKVELINKDGVVLYSNQEKETALKKVSLDWDSVKNPLMQGVKVGAIRQKNPKEEEEEILIFVSQHGYQDYKGNDWTLLICAPTKVVFASAIELNRKVIALLLVIAFPAFFMIYFLSNKLSRSIEELSEASEKVAEGDLDLHVKVASKGEAGRLAETFNRMVAELKESKDKLLAHSEELETRVAERTAELLDANKLLMKSKASLAKAQQIARLGNWESDMKSGNIFWSDEMYRIYGFADERFTPTFETFLDRVHPEDRAYVIGAVESAIKDNKPHGGDFRIVLPDGTVRYMHSEAELILDDAGRPVGLRGTAQDITEGKHAEEKIRDSEGKLRSIFTEARDGIVLIDTESGFIIDCNPEFERQAGRRAEELRGMRIWEIRPTEKVEAARNKFLEIAASGAGGSSELEFQRPDGDIVPIEFLSNKVTMGGKEYLQSMSRDITERKKIEAELEKAHRLESIGTLAGGIAHDFNNLLTVILGNISITKIYMNSDNKDFDKLTNAEKACMEATELTKRLITFAKGGDPVRKAVSLLKIVSEITCSMLKDSDIACEGAFPDNLAPVYADEGQIRQVFRNMAINAKEAMPEGGVLRVDAENVKIGEGEISQLKRGKYVRVSIKDSGKGIPEEILPKIFDPYFTTKGMGADKGRGLGLAVCHTIIKKHNGHITVESSAGQGTTFHIYLPAVEGEIRKTTEEYKPAATRKKKILFMDDEDYIRNIAGQILEHLGYEVEYAKDGSEAIKAYKEAKEGGKRFDAVILDLTVHDGMGGDMAIEKLISIDREVRAIVSSGYADSPVMTDFRKHGFAGAIAKPYSLDMLKETLDRVLEVKKG